MFLKRNVYNNLRLTLLLVLSAGIILTLTTGALAQTIETWSGPLTVQVKATELIGGKFVTKSDSVSGILELYTEVDGPPTPNNDGYYMRFIANNQVTIIGIKQLVLIDMQLNATSGKFLAVGVGEFFDPNAPGNPNGIAYLDFSGSWKAASSKKPANISLVIKMGGGIDGDVIFSANPKVTLTKQ